MTFHCPFFLNDCVLYVWRDEARRSVVFDHRRRGDERGSPESLFTIYDVDLSVPATAEMRDSLLERCRADHRMWAQGLMPKEFDEEAERARLRPV